MGKITVPTGEEFPEKATAVIIGGGIAGTATAFWLSMTELAWSVSKSIVIFRN